MDEFTQSLVRDHETILKAVNRLEERVEIWRRLNTVDVDSVKRFIEFARFFTDRCHHGKEERCLFPCMERRGIPREGGPIGVMLYEHELGRQLIKSLEQSAESYSKTGKGLENLLSICEDYVSLIRQHIEKENNILFPMAESVASDEDRNSTTNCYEKVESVEVGDETHRRLEKLAEEI
ncbi:MAG: hemerythrin domain-containing protein [Candidatus Caldarchaeum sp.]